jgi:tetratricopeptide (TPR) repeat protein
MASKRRHHNSKPTPQGKRSDPLVIGLSEQAPALTQRRKWFFRLAALVLVPLLVFGGLEAALRLAGYGYHTSFFEKIRVGEREFLVNNENFSFRFFPPHLMRWPGPIRMDASKSTDTYRIFILGESAAQGDPEPAYGAWRYLEMLLRERFPGQRFEVVNVAVTAINSHVILPIARECARHQGDLWIVYMGNNEMVGPFGAATVFGAQAPSWWSVRMNLTVQQTRSGQLFAALIRKLQGKSASSSWGGMQMFLENQLAPDDPRKAAVYRNFQRNLNDILEAGLDSGAKIILNTVAVNLRDCPPFASLSNSNLPAGDRATCEKLYADGCLAEEQGRFTEAAQRFEQAAKLDSKMSDLRFRWGNCLLHMTNSAAAREHFQMACDYDALPFRADARINSLIRQAAPQAGSGLVLFDAAAALETNNPARICGQESFYEHVHFNFDGSYRLALAWARQVEHFLPEGISNRAAGGWASQETCERRLGLTDWNRSLIIKSVVQRLRQPPLSGQFNNARRVEVFEGQMKELRQRMVVAAAMINAREIYRDALNRAPDDYMLHENFAQFLECIGDVKEAAAEWIRAHELSPRNPFAFCQAGRLLAQQSQWAEAQAALSQAVVLHPRYLEAWLELGSVLLAEGKFQLAMEKFDRARQLQPNAPRVHFERGRAFSLLHRSPDSLASFHLALQLKPDYWEAHYALGGELAMHDKTLEAKSEFENAIRLQPDYALAHFNLGVVLMKLRQPDEASRQFEETLRLEPTDRFALDYLKQTRAAPGNREP